MCVTAVGMAVAQFAMSAVSSVAGFMGQQQQYEAQQQQYKNNRIEANRAAVDNYASTQNRMLQDQKAASQELQQLNVDALKGRATAETAAGEAGVTGLSVDALVADYYGQEGRFERTLDNNLQMNADYLQGEMTATSHQTAGRINSVSQGQKPSFMDAGIRILGGAVDAFGSYNRYKQTTKVG